MIYHCRAITPAMTKSQLLFFSGIALLLTSCGASRWSEAQKASLGSIAVPPVPVAGDGYDKPIGSPEIAAPYISAPVGSGFAGGAIAAGVGQLAVEIAAVAEQKSFEGRYADAISKAPGTVPGDLSGRVRKAVAGTVGSLPHFHGKVRDDSPNRLVVTVEKFRYVRVGNDGGEMLMVPSLSGKFDLTGAGGTKLLSRNFNASATSVRRTIDGFVRDRGAASRAFDEAAAEVARQIGEAVGEKLGETPGAPAVTTPAGRTAKPGKPYQLSDVSGLTATCSNPYPLTQSCNIWSGAARRIEVGGQKLKIAGSADGKIILIRDAGLVPKNAVSSKGSAQYDAVKAALEASGVWVLKQRDMVSAGKTVGFFLETSGDAYGAITKGS
ncbi:hypothetical protein OKA04_11285 [Luteolibacter flavescens]|uniref:Lipoprotein n=1 Tax=Luteolibacter flavescens TaxID=1859460 RepID=A0ABT3FPS1_9BACT|nr:hypothetical protein [Luteolibacter flavescens]MCW1885314.1 hypothetical protein [Luteolibacter flavescens]